MLRTLRVAIAFSAAASIPFACGFPDYGGFDETQPGAGGSAASASDGGATGSVTGSGAVAGGGSGTGATGGGGSGGAGGNTCSSDADCTTSPEGPVCDTSSSSCVECLPSNDVCEVGTYCAGTTCEPGCDDDADCNVSQGSGSGGGGAGGSGGEPGTGGSAPMTPLTCNAADHTCNGCTVDEACPPGTLCDLASAVCIPGCSPKQECHTDHECCSGQCANVLVDEPHCGTCDTPCEPAGGEGVCSAGTCQIASCTSPLDDCDDDPTNGCESDPAIDPANCGGCRNACTPMTNAQPGCVAGVCALGACSPMYADCDGISSNGCEVNLNSSSTNCGQCGNACDLLNANAACQAGLCSVSSCKAGYADCDGGDASGCEVSTQSDPANCGSCDNACSFANANAGCTAGACTLGACAAPFANCNVSTADGCEINLNTSTQNCGACGTLCAPANATGACSNGGCAVGACNAGYADCDGAAANGCEVNLNTSTVHCGACGDACSSNGGTASCAAGSCAIACSAGFANCDANTANGCEIDITGNVNNCNGCGNVCPASGGTPACVNSQCTVTSCQPGKADCDGSSANGCEVTVSADPQNCGGCGISCFAANGTATCNGGVCVVASCTAGNANCNGTYADGCETALNTLTDCGACGIGCNFANANESCASGSCQLISCTGTFANCDANQTNGCEINTASSTAHCGACGNACSSTNGTASCTSGACGISCGSGWGNCDGNVGNGCETATINNVNACGGCGNVCAVLNGTPACSGTSCAISTCAAPYKNCDNLYSTGCEVNTATSTANCGNCGTVCTNANGSTSCQSSVCSPVCAAGYLSCDGNPNNGCETNVSTNVASCGSCGNACTFANASATCVNGGCVMGACSSGWADCDLMASNGCETPLNTLANCGACGNACSNAHGSTTCSAGTCAPQCVSGWASCDGNASNGCETSIFSTSNCGLCGVLCDYPNAGESCATGTCSLGTCSPGFGNCDGNAANGCETATNTSNQHCGGCNQACAAGKVCSNGSCLDACAPGTGNCDGNSANGCEVNTTNSGSHCGGCNIVCSDTQYCNGGACAACPAGQRDCDNAGTNACEVTSSSDPSNCGGCGTKCGADGTCGCSAGVCSGGTIYFSEDYSDNGKGWTLGTEWEIEAASVSAGHQQGNPDPATDHSKTSDNGVAGVAVGGNYSHNPVHDFYYLTSPVINLSAAAGTVKLTYWRWLNCDFDPYVVDSVEVYNGSAWVTVWSNSSLGNVLVADNNWLRFEHDVTAYKNAGFRVRFGHKTGQKANFLPFIMSGWNLDDVSLSSATCN
jgi:hypothetical protein